MNPDPRNEIKKFIKENLERQLSKKDANRHQKTSLKVAVESRAEELLSNFEKSLFIKEIKHIIIKDCKAELVKAGKKEKAIEAALIILAVIFTLLIGILSFGTEITLINLVAKGCLLLCAILLGLHVFMKLSH